MSEELYCPECDLFHNEEGQCMCEIIICANPTKGYSELDIEAHIKLITENFNTYYKKRRENE